MQKSRVPPDRLFSHLLFGGDGLGHLVTLRDTLTRRLRPVSRGLLPVVALASEVNEEGARVHTNVAIAGAVGTSEWTVREDLKEAASASRGTTTLPDTVIRKNGTTYPAHRKATGNGAATPAADNRGRRGRA